MRPQVYPRPSPTAPGSAAIWGARWLLAEGELGWDHPATQAAQGRQWALSKGAARVPQRNAKSPAAIAWHRASEAQPGYMNRRYRKHMRATAASSQ